eukprot:170242-Chlamydomonas_euryale.AAC.19
MHAPPRPIPFCFTVRSQELHRHGSYAPPCPIPACYNRVCAVWHHHTGWRVRVTVSESKILTMEEKKETCRRKPWSLLLIGCKDHAV